MHAFQLWEEAGEHRKNLCRYMKLHTYYFNNFNKNIPHTALNDTVKVKKNGAAN